MRLFIALLLATLTSCVGPKKLREEDARQLVGATIAVARKAPPSFIIFPGAGYYHIEDALGPSAKTEMSRIDPAGVCAHLLANDLVLNAGAKTVSGELQLISSLRTDDVSNLSPKADLVLALGTSGWNTDAGIFGGKRFRINITIEMKLVNVGTGKVIASGRYIGLDSLNNDSPWATLADVTNPSSPTLKQLMDAHAHRALVFFKHQYLTAPNQ